MPFICNKEIEQTGVQVTYWHEAELVYNMVAGKVVFTIKGYVSKEAYEAGKEAIASKFFEIEEGQNPQLAQAGKAFLLNYVRSLPDFEGSEDII